MISNCPICGGDRFEAVLYIDKVAVYQFVRKEEVPSENEFSELDIVQCSRCSHLFNRSFASNLGVHMYGDTPLSNISVHVSMMESLRLIAEKIGYDTYEGKNVIEIGAGTGHLARILAKKAATVIVFEPCLGLRPEMLPEGNIWLWNKNFVANEISNPVDLIVSRQVIEHLDNPSEMISDIAASLVEGGLAYLEVPRAEYIAKYLAIGDFHLAHVQYFTELNFLWLCSKYGLRPVKSFRLKNGHDVGFLFVREKIDDLDPILDQPQNNNLSKKLRERRDECFFNFQSLTGKIAFYGATRNGQAILEIVGDSMRIDKIFDDNSEYTGYALYNTSQVVPIGQPEMDNLSDFSCIIITSYLHEDIIAKRLRILGFKGRIITARPSGCSENKFGMEGLFRPIFD